jgi:hypothetical protein
MRRELIIWMIIIIMDPTKAIRADLIHIPAAEIVEEGMDFGYC